uniref:Uncharacterized protein n=1 Tax=viral metagenome TaxID=1070528 RepID=A0A6M3XBP9_9ZZZZ
MATDPKQEQIMKFAEAIRQMGMPNTQDQSRKWLAGTDNPAPDDSMTAYAGNRWPSDPRFPGGGGPEGPHIDPYTRPPITATEEQWQRQLQPYRPQVEEQYLDFASQQKGWNPVWNDYLPQLLRFLQNPNIDPTEGYFPGGSPSTFPGGPDNNRMPGIPKELWGQIGEFAKTIPGMKDFRPQNSGRVIGGTTQNPYAGTQYGDPGTAFTQPTESGRSTSVLSNLARKNAMQRQILARMMGRPTGANSLMELMGQQQLY